MPLVMSMHDIPYVATATLSHLEDYAKKLVKAREMSKKRICLYPCLMSLPGGLENLHG